MTKKIIVIRKTHPKVRRPDTTRSDRRGDKLALAAKAQRMCLLECFLDDCVEDCHSLTSAEACGLAQMEVTR